ncbi:hypothetical protein Q8A73_015444 [Channa argus]|nr:hypothetical protein Q8A73_015444 [Channa argus]
MSTSAPALRGNSPQSASVRSETHTGEYEFLTLTIHIFVEFAIIPYFRQITGLCVPGALLWRQGFVAVSHMLRAEIVRAALDRLVGAAVSTARGRLRAGPAGILSAHHRRIVEMSVIRLVVVPYLQATLFPTPGGFLWELLFVVVGSVAHGLILTAALNVLRVVSNPMALREVNAAQVCSRLRTGLISAATRVKAAILAASGFGAPSFSRRLVWGLLYSLGGLMQVLSFITDPGPLILACYGFADTGYGARPARRHDPVISRSPPSTEDQEE